MEVNGFFLVFFKYNAQMKRLSLVILQDVQLMHCLHTEDILRCYLNLIKIAESVVL